VKLHDSIFAQVGAVDRGAEQLHQVLLGVAVLGEDDHAAVGPLQCCALALGAADRHPWALVDVNPFEEVAHLGIGRARVLGGQVAHFLEQFACSALRRCEQAACRLDRGGAFALHAVVVAAVLAAVSVVVAVVRVGRCQIQLQGGLCLSGKDAFLVYAKGEREGVDAGQQSLLQIDEDQLAAPALGSHQLGVLGE